MMSLAALSDPTRRRIVEILAEGARPAGVIADHFEISAPAVSQHLRVLREARLVSVRVEGQRRIYHLDPSGFEELDNWLRSMRQSWSRRLDALENQLRRAAHEDAVLPDTEGRGAAHER